MTLKLLQLNIWYGAFMDEVIEYIKKEKFDLVHLQEISGGKMSQGGSYKLTQDDGSYVITPPLNPSTVGVDTLNALKTQLTNYHIEEAVTSREKNDPTTYNGNATCIKKSIKILSHKIIWLNDYGEFEDLVNLYPVKLPRCAISLCLEIEGKKLYAINAHLAWGPTPYDEGYKIEQAKKLADYIASLDAPYIFSADFNVVGNTEIVKLFARKANNLAAIHGVINTLNPRTHQVKKLFPKGHAVDFIFPDPLFAVKNFKVIDDIDLSDHFGLSVEVEI